MATECGVPVELYIYDLTNGLASLLSPAIIGRQVEGVWHTAVVVFEREYFYGGGGVTSCKPGGTQLGAPHQVERLGDTFVPFPVFVDYIQALATSTYTGSAYRLLEHNCNHFSDEVAQFLCGARVPKHIVQQPDALPPPLRLALAALLDNLVPDAGQAVYANGVRHSRQESPDYRTLNDQIEEARCGGGVGGGVGGAGGSGAVRRCVAAVARLVRAALVIRTQRAIAGTPLASQELEARRSTLNEKLARKERRRDKKRKKHEARAPHGDAPEMAEAVEAAVGVSEELSLAGPSCGVGEALAAAAHEDADERRREEQRKRDRDPPIVYTDIDGAAEFEKLSAALEDVSLSEEERQSLAELQQYLVLGEGSWVLGDEFLAFIGRLLSAETPAAVCVCALRCLCACALRDDVALLLHQDRRHHALLTYAHRIDTLTPPEQAALALFICNLFENISSSEWLLYISEWEVAGQPLSNIRATTKVCVHALLSESGGECGGELRDLGTAILHNLATKERFAVGKALRDRLPPHAKSKVFDEVCVELTMAALQLLQWAPAEEHLFRVLKALARLAHHSADVPQLIAVVGPDPAAFRGTSPRIDQQIDLIMKKIK